MKTYIFRTTATMKEHNRSKWFICSDIIGEKTITAENIKNALEAYAEKVNASYAAEISKNALKNKAPMYIDTEAGTKQTGFVITASTLFDKGDYTGFSKQYIDLWVDILTVTDTEF